MTALRAATLLVFIYSSATVSALMDRPLWLVPLAYDFADVAEPDIPQTDVSPTRIDRSRTWLARYLNDLSYGVDGFMVDVFFGDEILQDEVGGSRMKLSYDQRHQRGEDVEHKVKVSVNVKLPHLNDRLRLLIESEDDPEDERSRPPILEPLERQRISAALRVLLTATERWTTDVDVGVRGLLPPDPYTQFRARRFDQFGHWHLRTTQTVYYRVSDGVGERTALQWDYPLNTEKVVRLVQSAEYQLQKKYFDFGYSGGLYQQLSERQAIAYQFSASGDSQQAPAFEEYRATVQFRQQFYRSWLYFDVIPELLWRRDADYRTTPAITFRIEAFIAQ